MVLVEIDGNAIMVETMKNRTDGEMQKAYLALLDRLELSGITPKRHILDNEASKDFKMLIRRKYMHYELVPPDNHRRNKAERAIHTFKNHLKAILAGVDPSFPFHLWDRLLAQAETTLNLTRMANPAPKVSAYAYLHGP